MSPGARPETPSPPGMVMVTPSDCMRVGAVRRPVRRPPIGQASVMGTVGIAPGVGVTVAVGVALATAPVGGGAATVRTAALARSSPTGVG